MNNTSSINEYDLLITLLVGVIIFISIAAFIIVFSLLYQKRKKDFQNERQDMMNQFKQELLQSQLETQEYSFYQISEELHDNIGQLLSSTKLLLGIVSREMPVVPDVLHTAEETVGKAIQDLRSLSKSLDKEWLHRFNLLENIEAEKERINAARSIKVMLVTTTEKIPLEPDEQVMLFRVMQEALQNSIKHGSPKNITLTAATNQDSFTLQIEDDGCGFNIEEAKKESLGLRNMEHRVQLLGGTIAWESSNKGGTKIKIKIPVEDGQR